MRCTSCGFESDKTGIQIHWGKMHSGKPVIVDDRTYEEHYE